MLVGWDAADWKVIHQLMDEGKMPATQKLVDNGVMGNLATLSPVLSPMLWTSIATGKRPFKHGIYGFTEPTPDRSTVQPMTNVSRKCKAIWNILNQNQKKSIVVGWWPSHPAEPIDGVMVSDFFHKVPRIPGQSWDLMDKCIHPAELTQELEQVRIHPAHIAAEFLLPFVPNIAKIDQMTDSRLSSVIRVLSECTSIHGAATHLLETQEWDFAAIYYDAIDHFSHGFMRYHPPRQQHISEEDFEIYKNVVAAGYIYHDMMLARLLELAGEDTTVLLMSDHGFHPDHLRSANLPTEPAGPALEHRDQGIFVASGPGIRKDEIIFGANLLDVTPTILSMYGLPIGEDMDGKPLLEIYENPPEIKTIPSWEQEAGPDGQHPPNLELGSRESKQMLEQLIALGYIDRPNDNSDVAIADCERELRYNLARSWMDADQHGDATALLAELYQQNPLEFRFGIQLASCLRVTERTQELESLIENMNGRWRLAQQAAKERLREIATLTDERMQDWKELKKIDEANADDPSNPPPLARVSRNGKPVVFADSESHAIRKIRLVARGNPQTLDFLAATVAMANGNFKAALQHMEATMLTRSKNPGFQYQLGNVYLALNRHKEAESAFMKALDFDPDFPNALLGLCRTSLDMNRVTEAVEMGQQAVRLKYHFPAAHFFWGVARRRHGDISGAVQSLTTAIKQNPNFVEAHLELAEIYSDQENNQELALEHRAMAKELKDAQSKQTGNWEPISFADPEELDFSQILPDVASSNSETFVPCLAQPRRASQQEESSNDPSTSTSTKPTVFVVSGVPRSGTSMMMQMLVAGGMEPFTDRIRRPDDSNPKGYFESDKVKQLAHCNSWLDQCNHKVVKVVTPLVPYLPQTVDYFFISMQRSMDEVMASQKQMLHRLSRSGANLNNGNLAAIFQRQELFARNLMELHKIAWLPISYADAISRPDEVARQVAEFFPLDLDVQKMAAVVDPGLYRERLKSGSDTT